ncbi:MAG TPA: hypothetical protein VHZ51_06195, partial [Ktedonobacteraceae bacterium]|nr:hypothetical protein [Ktedonobacteraceae bacterium]
LGIGHRQGGRNRGMENKKIEEERKREKARNRGRKASPGGASPFQERVSKQPRLVFKLLSS